MSGVTTTEERFSVVAESSPGASRCSVVLELTIPAEELQPDAATGGAHTEFVNTVNGRARFAAQVKRALNSAGQAALTKALAAYNERNPR